MHATSVKLSGLYDSYLRKLQEKMNNKSLTRTLSLEDTNLLLLVGFGGHFPLKENFQNDGNLQKDL